MDAASFKNSLPLPEPPPGLSIYLQSLWWDHAGDWERSHHLIQDIKDKKAAWIHAYLHRKEGDIYNADYWYHKAGKERPELSLAEEWEGITNALCADE